VAHLIVNGADPRKILLMTFSRRAAAEMARRVERIARRVIGDNAGVMTDAPGPGPSMGSARGSCTTMRERSASILLSPFMIARIRPI
jgi:superfamily I DNA/RNA helicase